MNKKAQGTHIEIVISFVIFIGFLLFLIVVFNPLQQTENPKMVDFIFNDLNKEMSVERGKVSFSNKSAISGNCFSLQSSELIEDLNCSQNDIVVKHKTSSGFSQVDASVSDDRINISDDEGGFYTIYCAPGLDESSFSDSCDSVDFSLGIIKKRKIWSEEKLVDLKDNFGRYKSRISDKDFGFELIGKNSEEVKKLGGDFINVSSGKPDSVSVFAKTFPIEVLRNNASVERYKARVFVW